MMDLASVSEIEPNAPPVHLHGCDDLLGFLGARHPESLDHYSGAMHGRANGASVGYWVYDRATRYFNGTEPPLPVPSP